MSYYVKFTGKFPDLIKDGWTFQKLFGRNYRQYHKTCDGEKYSQGCRIWQHLGGYLEIQDLFDDSYLIVKQIQDGKINEWASLHSRIDWSGGKNKNFIQGKDTHYFLCFDNEDKCFFSRWSDKGRAIKHLEWDTFKKLESKLITDKEYEDFLHKHLDRYREFTLRPEMITMIQDLLDKKWISIEVDNRKS